MSKQSPPKDADELLVRVHARLGLGVDIQTYSAGTVEVHWRRDYGQKWSETRFFSALTLTGALQGVLDYEDAADAGDGTEDIGG